MFIVSAGFLFTAIGMALLKEYVHSVEQRVTGLELHRNYLMDRVRRLEENNG